MKLIKFLFVVIVTLVIGNVTLTNRTVDESIVVADLTAEIEELQNANTIAKAQVAATGSLSALTPRIEAAGFIESPKIVAVPTPSSVALR